MIKPDYETYLRLLMNLLIVVLVYHLVMNHEEMNKNLKKAKLLIGQFEASFMDTLNQFPAGIAIYTGDRGVQYINKYWEKTQLSLNYNSDTELIKELGKYLDKNWDKPNFQRNKDKVDLQVSRYFEMVKMKADNKVTLNDNIPIVYEKIMESKNGINDYPLDRQMHEYVVRMNKNQVIKEFDVKFALLNVPFLK